LGRIWTLLTILPRVASATSGSGSILRYFDGIVEQPARSGEPAVVALIGRSLEQLLIGAGQAFIRDLGDRPTNSMILTVVMVPTLSPDPKINQG
jgi:hypothetical protein